MKDDARTYRLALVTGIAVFLSTMSSAYAQNEVPQIQVQELYVIFGSFIAAIVILTIYISRDVILQKTNRYDANKFESQKDRDYEKYHSKWSDDWGWKGEKRRGFKHGEFDEDYYEILGVPRDAADVEIKSRYRELAKKSHPDKSKGDDSEPMVKINCAYETLSDRSLRKKYDEYLDGI